MPREIPIEIFQVGSPSPTQTAQFAPPTQVVQVDDLVFWRNNDSTSTHQPMPVGGIPDAWVTQPIPARVVNNPLGDDVATSNTVAFSSGSTSPQGTPYTCAKHSGERGAIVVVNYITINTSPGAASTAPQVAFAPAKRTVKVNERFVFINNDVKAHQIAPSTQQPTAWMAQPVQSGQTSGQIAVSQATPSTGMTYVCVLHPNETGTLIVK